MFNNISTLQRPRRRKNPLSISTLITSILQLFKPLLFQIVISLYVRLIGSSLACGYYCRKIDIVITEVVHTFSVISILVTAALVLSNCIITHHCTITQLSLVKYLSIHVRKSIKPIQYRQYQQMQNTVCKRIAKSFDLQRYIPEYQVYQLCINWESEIPVPPTIFYLSEIFIYPYTLPESQQTIKKEPLLNIPNKICIDSKTKYDLDISTSVYNRVSHSHLGSLGACPFEEESKSEKSESAKVLNYDELMSSSIMMHQVKVRNRMIVKRIEFKTPAEGRKRRKT